MPEKFLTTEEVAQKLSLKVRSVRRLIRTSELPGIYIGKAYRIPESELLRWMDAHKIRRQ
ncbi:MAG: helix-turn-helix domain-containing protein [Thermoplasmata archaeon]|nr:helix-turn-helix domain-containing protein [Thermoplasmata archaeon]